MSMKPHESSREAIVAHPFRPPDSPVVHGWRGRAAVVLCIVAPVLLVLGLFLESAATWLFPAGAVLGMVGLWLFGFFSSHRARDPRNLHAAPKA